MLVTRTALLGRFPIISFFVLRRAFFQGERRSKTNNKEERREKETKVAQRSGGNAMLYHYLWGSPATTKKNEQVK